MNKTIILAVVILAIVSSAYAYSSIQSKAAMEEQKMMAAEKEMMEKEAMAEVEKMEKEEMMKDGEDMMKAESMMEDKEMMDKDEMMKKEEADMTDKSEVGMEDKKEMMKSGVYEAYSADKLMRAETGDVVLFFHASWCPSCRGLNASIESNLASIPEGVSILKVDYDTSTALKQKYGVTSQHTLVQVDKNGNLIAKWSGSSSLDKVLMEIK